MSGPSCMMAWCSPPRLKLMLLTAFLLTSTNIVCLHGGPVTGVDMHCLNNLFTINCSLSIAPSKRISDGNSSYWLTVTDLETTVCALTNTDGDYFCSVNASDIMHDDDLNTFGDFNIFEISLCHNKNDTSETCDVLDEEYKPVNNIKPDPPCCLAVNHNSSHHHFTWKSTYEKYRSFTALVDNLQYQLHYYKRGDRHNVRLYDKQVKEINTNKLNFLLDNKRVVPGTEYAARVRSSPNHVSYDGQWSDWSSEVHWRTEDPPFNVGKVFIPLCVLLPLVFLLCYAPVKKWRQSAFIPTPAPYFNNLYSDCQGDFKSWVVTQENTADMLKAEETLQIDTLTKCVSIQEEECQPQCHHHFMEGSTYSNITDPGCDISLLGVPYAVSTMAPPSAPGSSLKSLTLSSQPGSPTEGDSGCWLWSHTSLERDAPFYCNEYCTLSTFQQPGPVMAEHHCGTPTKSCLTEMTRVEAVTEA